MLDFRLLGRAFSAVTVPDACCPIGISQCVQAALEENVPATEIQDAFDDLAAFIDNEIEEERERREGRDEDDDETFLDEDEEEDE